MLRKLKRKVGVYGLTGMTLLGLALAACNGRSGITIGPRKSDPTQVLPSDSGACPAGTSLCGAGTGARCYSLDSDPMNCGACGQTCVPGIACSGGTCQQLRCTGAVAFHQIAAYPSSIAGDYPYKQPVLYFGADMNRDGRLDLLESDEDGNVITWLGQGDGTFVASTGYATVGGLGTRELPGYAAVGDFDEDGLADLAVTSSSGALAVRPGIPGGGLGGKAGRPLSRSLMGDLDGDGHLDLIQEHHIRDGHVDQFTVLRGRGDGTFAGAKTKVDDLVGHLQLADWDGNGTLDLLAFGRALSVLQGSGDGTFAVPQRCAPVFGIGNFLAFADLNQDKRLDAVAVLGPGNGVATTFGSGDCNFTPTTTYLESFKVGVVGIGDLSGDGVVDLVIGVSPQGGGGAVLLTGKDDGSFVPEAKLNLDLGDSTLFIADVTSDGLPDIVSVGFRGIVVFSNTCAHQ